MIKYPVESIYDPCLMSVNNQLYAVGGGSWLPVPNNTTLDNIHLYMKRKEYVPNLPIKRMQVKIKGKAYKVEIWKNKSITCECTGFRYRKNCKHVQAVQKMVNN